MLVNMIDGSMHIINNFDSASQWTVLMMEWWCWWEIKHGTCLWTTIYTHTWSKHIKQAFKIMLTESVTITIIMIWLKIASDDWFGNIKELHAFSLKFNEKVINTTILQQLLMNKKCFLVIKSVVNNKISRLLPNKSICTSISIVSFLFSLN